MSRIWSEPKYFDSLPLSKRSPHTFQGLQPLRIPIHRYLHPQRRRAWLPLPDKGRVHGSALKLAKAYKTKTPAERLSAHEETMAMYSVKDVEGIAMWMKTCMVCVCVCVCGSLFVKCTTTNTKNTVAKTKKSPSLKRKNHRR